MPKMFANITLVVVVGQYALILFFTYLYLVYLVPSLKRDNTNCPRLFLSSLGDKCICISDIHLINKMFNICLSHFLLVKQHFRLHQ